MCTGVYVLMYTDMYIKYGYVGPYVCCMYELMCTCVFILFMITNRLIDP